MREMNRFGLAAGLAAALAFAGTARAQSTQSDQTTSRPSERSGSPGSSAAPSEQGTGASAAPSDQGTGPSTTQPSPQGSGQAGTGASESGTATGAEQSGMAGTSAAGEQPKINKTLSNDLEKLHATNQAEIHMGQMAEQQAQSSEVKDYGRKLVDDHQKLDEKLQSEASNLGVNLEGKEYQKALKDSEKSMQKLQGKSGAAFDKEFLSIAEKGHKKAEKDTSKAAKQARKDNQESLAALFSQADTGIKGHASEAKRISKDVQKEGKTQGRKPPAESGTGTTGGSSSSEQHESGSMGSSSGTTGMGSGSAGTPGH